MKVLRLVDGDVKPSMGYVYGELLKAKKEIKESFGNVENKLNNKLMSRKEKIKRKSNYEVLLNSDCDTPAQGIIGLIGYSYQQVATSFRKPVSKELRG